MTLPMNKYYAFADAVDVTPDRFEFYVECYLTNEVDARIAELEKALRYVREEIEGDGNPGWTTLVDAIDKALGDCRDGRQGMGKEVQP